MSDNYVPTTEIDKLLGFIDQTLYANEDSSELVMWTNAEVLELLSDIRALAIHTATHDSEVAAKAWDALADVVMPLYEVAETVLCNGAHPQTLLDPLAAVGRQTNPYRPEVAGE